MAGMLPGVESARRRRFHQTGVGFSDSNGSTRRRSSFCLYSSNFASHHNTFSMQKRSCTSTTTTTNTIYNNNKDEELGGVAKVAKDRLDERLKAQWKSADAKRIDVRTTRGGGNELQSTEEEEVIGLKNGRSLKWGKLLVLGWRSVTSSSSSSTVAGGQQEEELEECAICLEGFKSVVVLLGGGDNMQIACGHRFHSRCLLPWLDSNAHCPCCRMPVTP